MADATDPQSPYLKSSLPDLNLPPGGFVSNIPEHLLASETPATQWIMRELSKNSQATEFACQAAVTHNEHLKALNGRTLKNEKAAEEIRADVAALKSQGDILNPISKAIGSFAYLWESKFFRVIFILGLFVISGVLYPWYVSTPGIAIVTIVKSWLGLEH